MSILLTEQEVVEIAEEHGLCTMVTDAGYKNDALWFDGDKCDFARSIQLALIEKLRKEPACYHFRDDPACFAMPGSGYSLEYPTEALDITPLYRLPTPQELDES